MIMEVIARGLVLKQRLRVNIDLQTQNDVIKHCAMPS